MLKVKSEAELPENVRAALRAQGALDASPPDPRDGSTAVAPAKSTWGFRAGFRLVMVAALAYLGVRAALAMVLG